MKGFNKYQTLGNDAAAPGAPNRSVPQRIQDYGLNRFVTPLSSVLDIGCNRGYFGIVLSRGIRSYTGIDHDVNEISYGKKEATRLRLSNVDYTCTGFEQFKTNQKYDIVFSFAVHAYVKMAPSDYASKINALLNPGGYLILESHPVGYMGEPAKRLNKLCDVLVRHFKFTEVDRKPIKDRANKRELIVWRKSLKK